ncbi:putative endo-polygalacturonase [Helianthus annuus]|nr:putative endo-polygalacturonase [Helianthus annuus]
MASQKHISHLSFVIVLFFYCVSCYSFSYHEDVHDYMSPLSRVYTCCIRKALLYMFQDPGFSSSLLALPFDVDSFGAKGDGKKDDTNAFKKAWKEACSSTTAAIFSVAKNKKYLVTPIQFEGPCRASLTMQISGTILASKQESKYKKNEKNWLRVEGVDNLVVKGGGVIDGNGDIWWSKSCKVNKTLALTFYKCKSLMLNNLTVQNAQKIHVTFDHCENVQVSQIQVTAPEDSPNTDGIHVTHTQNIRISDSVIGTVSMQCRFQRPLQNLVLIVQPFSKSNGMRYDPSHGYNGDDCISIVNGSKNVQATGITCGPGHGISIGSLGSKNSKAHVSNVKVDGAELTGTTNGVRIKTWQGGSGNASNITFQNINMKNVTNPIIIDQYYCDQAKPCKEQESAVQIKYVTYENISGTSASKDAVIFKCSKNYPCEDVVLKGINLTQEDDGDAKAICNNVKVTYVGTVIPRCSENLVQEQSTLMISYLYLEKLVSRNYFNT